MTAILKLSKTGLPASAHFANLDTLPLIVYQDGEILQDGASNKKALFILSVWVGFGWWESEDK